MENNLKFNSAICTSRVQSERLLSLGLKKETADMVHSTIVVLDNLVDLISEHTWTTTQSVSDSWFPAWSLHRLIEMVAGGSEEQMIFLPDPYDELIEEIAGAIMVGCFPKEYLDGLDSKR